MNSLSDPHGFRVLPHQAQRVINLADHAELAEQNARQREFEARELTRRIRAEMRNREDRRLTLTPDEEQVYTFTALRLATHQNYLPKFGRAATARTAQLRRMAAVHRQLALLTVYLGLLDELPLRAVTMPGAAREQVSQILPHLLFPGMPYTVDIQRGVFDGTHAHLFTPITALLEADEVRAAGRDGWIVGDGLGHAVMLGHADTDLIRAARYVCRPADARLSDRTCPDFLQAVEEELQRRSAGQKSLRLSWESGVRNL